MFRFCNTPCNDPSIRAARALHRRLAPGTFVGGTPDASHPEKNVEVVLAISRKFVDSDGVHWQVYQLTPADGGFDDDGGHDGWLYFFSRGATRSLAPFPDDWFQMDWPGLERLCRRAQPPVRREPAIAGRIANAP